MAKKGERYEKGERKGATRGGTPLVKLALADFNFTKDMSKRCQCLARIPEEEFEEK